MRTFGSKANGEAVLVIARDLNGPGELPLVLAEGDASDVRDRLAGGEVVVGTVLAERKGLKVGENLQMETPTGVRSLRVAGLVVDYTVGGYVVVMQRKAAEEVFRVQGADVLVIRAQRDAQPDARAALRDRLTKLCQEQGLMVHSAEELSQFLDELMNGILRGLWALLVLGLVVAGFGIGNTLMMNVLEQTREIALLRVVGMTQRQVRKMVLAQATIIGLLGLGLGIAGGLNTAYIISSPCGRSWATPCPSSFRRS